MEDVKDITVGLKRIIDEKGPGYLTGEPYQAYLEWIKSEQTEQKMASRVLYVLMNDVPNLTNPAMSVMELTREIQDRCGLAEGAAKEMAAIFRTLYSPKNVEEWKRKEKEGLLQFLKEEISYTWNGFSIWSDGNGEVESSYQADLVILPTENVVENQQLKQQLQRNPFLTTQAIRQYFLDDLKQYLDREFDEYCTADPYYAPMAEDFDAEDRAAAWCRENAFRLIQCEGMGYDGEYTPTYSERW